MTKRKERILKELYAVTEKINEPEITPVLRGSCRIQGPVEETDQDDQKKTGPYRGEKRLGGHSLSENFCTRARSGTCNVCASPCSSCMHYNRAVSRMELKPENEFSDETARGNTASQCSFNVADGLPPPKNVVLRDRLCAASETSNILSANSSHDSFSENAESKATLRTFDTCDASDDVEMLPVVSSGGTVTEDRSPLRQPESVSSHVVSDVKQRNSFNQFEEQKGLECDGDNISCVSGVNDANIPITDVNVNVERKNVSSSSATVSSLLPERSENADHVQLLPGCSTNIKCEAEENCGKFRRPSIFSKEFIQKNSLTSASAVGGCLTKSAQEEVPSSKVCCAGNGSPEVRSPCSHSRSSKSAFSNADRKNLEENSTSSDQAEISLPKSSTLNSAGAEKQSKNSCFSILPKIGDSKANHMGSTSASVKIYPFVEAGIDIESENSLSESKKCLDINEKVEKSIVSSEAPSVTEPPLHSHSQPVDENDGSDIEEDVKVCDICGDAGREDLLAICSRCGDGAEHTYCMRIMVDKVPEGDWLCEECKFKEESENQKQDKSEVVVETSKVSCVDEKSLNSICCKPSTKSDVKASDTESHVAPKVSSNVQIPSKRHLDNLDGVSVAKRQALETSSGSPKATSPSKRASLSRESSFKNLDKGRFKPAQKVHTSLGLTANNFQENLHSPTSGPNPSRIQSRQQPRGTLLKSNSFAAPKVKMVQEDLTHKSKLARDTVAGETKKEGHMRTLSKSLSLRTGSRSNSTSSKLKVHTTDLFSNEDLRGLKLTKERGAIERKNSFKIDRSLVTTPRAGSSGATLKAEKVGSRGESMSVSSQATNFRNLKGVQSDAKVSKPPHLILNRGMDSSKSFAGTVDPKRQSPSLSRGILSPSSNGIFNNSEQKPSQVSPKDERQPSQVSSKDERKPSQVSPKDERKPSQVSPKDERKASQVSPKDERKASQVSPKDERKPSQVSPKDERKPSQVSPKDEPTGPADRPCSNPDVVLRDGLPQSQEPTSQSRQSISGGDGITRCHKCKEIGHIAQFCSSSTSHVSVEARSSSEVINKNSEVINKNSKFKIAVEAAMSRRSGVQKKSRTPDQSDELSMSYNDMSCEVASKDQSSASLSCSRILTSVDQAREGQEGFSSLASSVVVPLSISSIPQYDYIWQGGFEVQRSGRLVDFFDGIQAHLSTCASPKVPDMVTKFTYKVKLEEVPRSSTWPAQFQNHATEDNIALYFFAKDLESYERNYKSLLENMIKNDLALKGNFNGIQLLIFPSNQLHEKSQRWNTLFYLWGVFKGRKVNCSEYTSGSQKKISQTNLDMVHLEGELPTPSMAGSHRDFFSGYVKELSTDTSSLTAQEPIKSSGPMDLSFCPSFGRVDTNCSKEVESLDLNATLQSEFNPLGSVLDNNSLPGISKTDELAHEEMKGNSTSMEEHRGLESTEMEIDSCSHATSQNSGLNYGNTVQVNLDKLNCYQVRLPSTSSDGKVRSSGPNPVSMSPLSQEAGPVRSRVEEKIQERSNNNEVTVLEKVEEEMVDSRTILSCDLVKNEYGSFELKSSRKRPYSDSSDPILQGSGETSTSSSQSMPWKGNVNYIVVDEDIECKKLKTNHGDFYGSSSSTGQISLNDRFLNREQGHDGAFEDMIPGKMRTAERFFFPMGLGPSKDWRVENSSTPLQVISSDDEDQSEPDVPNLELALGAEKRPSSKQGVLPFFVGLDEKKDQSKRTDNIKSDNKEDDVLASLSLSLAFPLSDKEKTVNPVSKPEQLLPDRRPNVDTSLLLFGGFPDT